ncbi:MAG: hypothetical protein ACJAT2_002212 [Bacteriovoracaceae bacterium]
MIKLPLRISRRRLLLKKRRYHIKTEPMDEPMMTFSESGYNELRSQSLANTTIVKEKRAKLLKGDFLK